MSKQENLYVNEIVVRVNSNLLSDFYKTTAYITKKYNICGNYDNSVAYKYILNKFNSEFNKHSVDDWINIINTNNSRIKKDTKISFWIMEKPYKQFVKNCNKLKIDKSKIVRALMNRLISEYEEELL
jgi:hypothetical protein